MATDGTTKRRKSTGPRQARPVFALVNYIDDSGNPMQLDKNRLTITIERDSAKIVDLLTSGDNSNAAVVRVELPQPQKRGAGAEALASA